MYFLYFPGFPEDVVTYEVETVRGTRCRGEDVFHIQFSFLILSHFPVRTIHILSTTNMIGRSFFWHWPHLKPHGILGEFGFGIHIQVAVDASLVNNYNVFVGSFFLLENDCRAAQVSLFPAEFNRQYVLV